MGLVAGCGDESAVCVPPDGADPVDEVVVVQRTEGGFRDFAFVHDGERFHIIGIDGRNGDWTEAVQGDSHGFVHMTSTDLRDWVEEEPITHPLYAHEYAQHHIWAPSIIQVGGEWSMFYTGVRRGETASRSEQRIMRSTSHNLYDWTEPTFVLDGTHPLTAWGGDQPWDNDCRDPHVFAMEGLEGVYGMVMSLRQADREAMIIGWALSRDFENWTITNVLNQTGTTFWEYFYGGSGRDMYAESPFLLQRAGKRYLFRTVNIDPLPVVQFQGPTYFIDKGKACEILPRGDGTYWFAYLANPRADGFDIEITTMVFEDERPVVGE